MRLRWRVDELSREEGRWLVIWIAILCVLSFIGMGKKFYELRTSNQAAEKVRAIVAVLQHGEPPSPGIQIAADLVRDAARDMGALRQLAKREHTQAGKGLSREELDRKVGVDVLEKVGQLQKEGLLDILSNHAPLFVQAAQGEMIKPADMPQIQPYWPVVLGQAIGSWAIISFCVWVYLYGWCGLRLGYHPFSVVDWDYQPGIFLAGFLVLTLPGFLITILFLLPFYFIYGAYVATDITFRASGDWLRRRGFGWRVRIPQPSPEVLQQQRTWRDAIPTEPRKSAGFSARKVKQLIQQVKEEREEVIQGLAQFSKKLGADLLRQAKADKTQAANVLDLARRDLQKAALHLEEVENLLKDNLLASINEKIFQEIEAHPKVEAVGLKTAELVIYLETIYMQDQQRMYEIGDFQLRCNLCTNTFRTLCLRSTNPFAGHPWDNNGAVCFGPEATKEMHDFLKRGQWHAFLDLAYAMMTRPKKSLSEWKEVSA